jgi:uncharacterized membrane protein YhaH (DUF805 family)
MKKLKKLYFRAILNFSDFKGRSSRKEFWAFALVQLSVILPLILLDWSLGILNDDVYLGIFSGLFIGLTLLPGCALTVRRLHDTNRSGWCHLLGLIPFAGPLLLVWFYCDKSTSGDNTYGAQPRHARGLI